MIAGSFLCLWDQPSGSSAEGFGSFLFCERWNRRAKLLLRGFVFLIGFAAACLEVFGFSESFCKDRLFIDEAKATVGRDGRSFGLIEGVGLFSDAASRIFCGSSVSFSRGESSSGSVSLSKIGVSLIVTKIPTTIESNSFMPSFSKRSRLVSSWQASFISCGVRLVSTSL